MNPYFRFKQFEVRQERCAMKVSTDSCLFGAWAAAYSAVGGPILDIGAGTGLLSLMVAQATEAQIDAVEIEEQCYAQLQENFAGSPWASRLEAIHGDIRTMSTTRKYRFILSNPPFYEGQLASPDGASNAARHSSALTLAALFDRVSQLMEQDGKFCVLLPYFRKDEMMAEAAKHGMHAEALADARHSPGHAWYRTMAVFGLHPVETTYHQIDVRNERGAYSEGFSELLAPYYLYL